MNFYKKIYSNRFKHGWTIDLQNVIFNKYYKMITNTTHISNNYNRNIIHKPKYQYGDSFRDILFEKEKLINLIKIIKHHKLMIMMMKLCLLH